MIRPVRSSITNSMPWSFRRMERLESFGSRAVAGTTESLGPADGAPERGMLGKMLM